MESLGRYLIVAGLLVVLLGAGVLLAARFDVRLGRLPGDIRIEGDGGGFYFPIATSVLLSVLLTIAINLLLRIFRK
jgi:hypothetical protein